MNPEENNPLQNPVSLGAGSTTDPNATPISDLATADGLSSAQESLTSAGLAATTDNGVMGLDQIGASAPEAIMAPPIEEPLVPAAPVPGSIGSVTSVPPLAADPIPAPASTTDPMSGAAAPAPTPEPAAAPAPAAPFNPFAQPIPPTPAAPAPASPEAPAPAPAPNFQPPVPPKPKKGMSNPLAIVFAAVAGILLVTTILFAVLYFKAKNNPKIVYVPSVSQEENEGTLEILTCSAETDVASYAGLDYPVYGTGAYIATYSDDDLSALEAEYVMPFGDDGLAATAQASLESIVAIAGAFGESFITDADYNVANGTLTATLTLDPENVVFNAESGDFEYDSEGVGGDVSLETVRAASISLGYNCSTK